MLWLRSIPSCLKSYASNCFISSKKWTHTYTYESTAENLLSVLYKCQSRSQLVQIHCQIITTGGYKNIIPAKGNTIGNKFLRVYSQGSFPEEAFKMHKQIQDTKDSFIFMDTFTVSFLLKACANLMELKTGVILHAHIVKIGFEFHVYVQTALLNMYLMCRSLSEAIRAFDEMPHKNQVSWNVMITGLTKWGEMQHACRIFERMPYRNIVSWTGIIDGHTRANRPKDALALFHQMMVESVRPTDITILTIVPAISNMGNLYIGQSIHAYTEKSSYSASDIRINNSLIDMYGKCGSVENALKVFREITCGRNLVSWTTMISAFAMHGMAREAISLFEEMKKVNLKPNRVTFLSVLHACSHRGLVEEGLKFFQIMIKDYGIMPDIKHYGCVVDMLGRSGRLEEAEKRIEGMPMKENVIPWRTLLFACTHHGNSEMGERVLEKIMEFERDYGADYILLSNVFTQFGRFTDAERVRMHMDDSNVAKVTGHSLIDARIRI